MIKAIFNSILLTGIMWFLWAVVFSTPIGVGILLFWFCFFLFFEWLDMYFPQLTLYYWYKRWREEEERK